MSKKLITISLSDSVRKAYQVMQERKIRHLPVTAEGDEIIGILSDRDIQRAMTSDSEDSQVVDEIEINENLIVKNFMTWPVRSVSEDVPIQDVAQRMLNEKVSAFVVVDSTRAASGIVTTDDLLRLLIKLLQKDPDNLKLSLGSVMLDFGLRPGHWV